MHLLLVLLNGSSVQQWYDESDSGYASPIQDVPSLQPTFISNGLGMYGLNCFVQMNIATIYIIHFLSLVGFSSMMARCYF